MPELTERKLLCRTCNGEEYRFTHLPSAPAGYHPFDAALAAVRESQDEGGV